MIIENTVFRLVDGADEETFLAADARVQQEFFYAQPGIVRRTLARGDDGEWLSSVLWSDAASADAASAAAQAHPGVQQLSIYAEPGSMRTSRYTDIGG